MIMMMWITMECSLGKMLIHFGRVRRRWRRNNLRALKDPEIQAKRVVSSQQRREQSQQGNRLVLLPGRAENFVFREKSRKEWEPRQRRASDEHQPARCRQ